jgi:hypothetical protein
MDSELEAFKEYLSNLELYDPAQHDDKLLCRFLRARQGNLELAGTMFADTIQWRKDNKVDTIYEFEFTEFDKVKEYLPRAHHKTDKMGRPVQIRSYSKLNIDEVERITTTDRMLMNHIQEDEKYARYRLPACSKAKGEHIEKLIVIMDIQGFPLLQFPRIAEMLRACTHASQNNYPEMMAKAVVINAPYLFSTIWSLVKRLLPQETIDKVSILGSNYKGELLDLIDAENLPTFYGGTCECPGGCENADVGPWNDGTVQGYPNEPWESIKKRM